MSGVNKTLYLDQDSRDEIQRAKDAGKSDEFLAGQTGFSVEELCRLMGWPQWRPEPVEPAAGDFDLWAVDRLADVL